ncbi:MAG: hypothetical protein N2712_04135 [Brevinematales bacterium]|nr:hypothetical protein [Brevinematales bacterium]
MAIDNLVKVLEEEVSKEISEILTSARLEYERILNTSKSKIDEEFESKRKELVDNYNRKILLDKLYIESETNREINAVLSQVLRELQNDITYTLKKKILSLDNYKELIVRLINKSIKSLKAKDSITIIISRNDYANHKDYISQEIKKIGIQFELSEGDIEGGAMIKYKNITIDVSIDRIVEMFTPVMMNSIYKALPKTKL